MPYSLIPQRSLHIFDEHDKTLFIPSYLLRYSNVEIIFATLSEPPLFVPSKKPYKQTTLETSWNNSFLKAIKRFRANKVHVQTISKRH